MTSLISISKASSMTLKFKHKTCLLACATAGLLTLAACGSQSPDLQAQPLKVGEKVNYGEKAEVPTEPKVDILFVVDNSGSMKPYQDKMARNVELFANEFFSNSRIDYRIGVVPVYDSKYLNDETVYNPSGRRKMNPLGELVALKGIPSDAGNKLFITRSTPNAREVLKQTVVIGTQWGPEAEESFSPVLAVTNPQINQQKNAGFYQQDAYLAVIFLTDADDVTLNLSGEEFYERLVALKGGDASKVLIAAAIPTSCPAPTDGEGPIKSIPDLMRVSGGLTADLCSNNFGAQLAKFGRHLAQRVTERKVQLDFEPDISTLKVTHGLAGSSKEERAGSVVNPQVYRYDPVNRTVMIIDSKFAIPADHVLFVEATEVLEAKRSTGRVREI